MSSRPVLVKRTHLRMQLEKVSVNFSQVRSGENPQDLWLSLFAADARGFGCSPALLRAPGFMLALHGQWSFIL